MYESILLAGDMHLLRKLPAIAIHMTLMLFEASLVYDSKNNDATHLPFQALWRQFHAYQLRF